MRLHIPHMMDVFPSLPCPHLLYAFIIPSLSEVFSPKVSPLNPRGREADAVSAISFDVGLFFPFVPFTVIFLVISPPAPPPRGRGANYLSFRFTFGRGGCRRVDFSEAVAGVIVTLVHYFSSFLPWY